MGHKHITNQLVIKFVDKPENAPNYGSKWTAVKAHKAIVVSRGMQGGAPSIDIQLTDNSGKEYVLMGTGAIFELLGKAITGRRERDQAMDKAVAESAIQTKQ